MMPSTVSGVVQFSWGDEEHIPQIDTRRQVVKCHLMNSDQIRGQRAGEGRPRLEWERAGSTGR